MAPLTALQFVLWEFQCLTSRPSTSASLAESRQPWPLGRGSRAVCPTLTGLLLTQLPLLFPLIPCWMRLLSMGISLLTCKG